MKEKLTLSCLILALLVIGAPALAEDAKEETVLTGEYHWTARDMSGPVKAHFTPAGEGKWDVSFHFEFRSEPRTYTGVAEGSLTSGSLKGEVKNEDKKRTFTFDGTITEGTFEGTHNEIREDGVRDTGTIVLKLEA